jgi:hypothetical protein
MMPGGTTSPRSRAALALPGFVVFALLVAGIVPPASAAPPDSAQAPPTLPQVPVIYPNVEPPAPSYKKAYIALAGGAALSIASFVLAESADRAYDRYLSATDPTEIEDAYQDAESLDHLSAGTLLVGTSALVLGVYWRFVKKPGTPSHAMLESSSGLDVTLQPAFDRRHVGLALAVSWP